MATQETKSYTGVLVEKSQKQGGQSGTYWSLALGSKEKPWMANLFDSTVADELALGKTYQVQYTEKPNPKGKYPYKDLKSITEVEPALAMALNDRDTRDYAAERRSIERQKSLAEAVAFMGTIAPPGTKESAFVRVDIILTIADQFYGWITDGDAARQPATQAGTPPSVSGTPPSVSGTPPSASAIAKPIQTPSEFWLAIGRHEKLGRSSGERVTQVEKDLTMPLKAWIDSGKTFDEAYALVKEKEGLS